MPRRIPFLSTGQSKLRLQSLSMLSNDHMLQRRWYMQRTNSSPPALRKFSREAIITAGFVEFKPLNGYSHFFPVWWCNWGSIVQSVWPARPYHLICGIVRVIAVKYGMLVFVAAPKASAQPQNLSCFAVRIRYSANWC